MNVCPMPGTELTREYRGQRVVARVLEDGFEYNGSHYPFASIESSYSTKLQDEY